MVIKIIQSVFEIELPFKDGNSFEPRNDVFTFSLSWILDIAKSYPLPYVQFEVDLMAWNR